MESTTAPRPGVPEAPRPPTRLTRVLDGFLSEPLRTAPPAELQRHRVLISATLGACALTWLYLLVVPFTRAGLATLLTGVGYLGTLLLARKARTLHPPAMLLCLSAAVGYVVSVFLGQYPEGGLHAASMLIPCFAVYLMGPRQGFVITGFLFVALGIAHPLYRAHLPTYSSHIPLHEFTAMQATAALSLLGAWVLNTLHTTSRDAAQEALERTLKTLSESEGKLLSLVESTDDMVCSLDTDKRVITANAAMRRIFVLRQGRELVPGEPFVFPRTPVIQARWSALLDAVLAGQRLRFEEESTQEGSPLFMDVSMSPILGADGRVTGLTLSARDITARKLAETRLGDMHRKLVDVSRYAGMAEIATGVLHNVGNTLNSVNISASILSDQLRHSRVANVRKAATLLREHVPDASTFLAMDPRGQQLPDYLLALAEELEKERESLRREVGSLTEGIEHIKSIVAMQQEHARATGMVERLPVPQLIEEALRLHAGSFERQGIHIEREYEPVPSILVDRHNLLQILVNLLNNARHALLESRTPDKRMSIRIRLGTGGERLLIEVSDNGVGIPPENMARLFSQGFTTKKTGHGFGLHISALAAARMSGRLTCTSAGTGQGATFALELPVEGPREQQDASAAPGPEQLT